MNGKSSTAQTLAIRRAIRLTKGVDSITHGPRMKAGRSPPSVTGPIVRRFGFTSAALSPQAPTSPSGIAANSARLARRHPDNIALLLSMARDPTLIGLPPEVSVEEAAAQFDLLQKK